MYQQHSPARPWKELESFSLIQFHVESGGKRGGCSKHILKIFTKIDKILMLIFNWTFRTVSVSQSQVLIGTECIL